MISKKNTFLILIFIVFLIVSLLIISRAKKEIPVEKKEVIVKAKVAIVIDDLGYNLKNLDLIYSIKPLTLSILPNLPYSKRIAVNAATNGYEVMLHLPLEAHEKDAPMEVDTICVGMTEAVILEKLSKAIVSIPMQKGISNHMGSKATEDASVMRVIFKELNKKGLYFLDSMATDKSVCEELAKEMHIRFAERDVYLDNVSESDYIRNQFKLLIEQAKKNGFSIGIGHDRPLTVKTLVEEMPKFQKEDIEFVFVSELVKQY